MNIYTVYLNKKTFYQLFILFFLVAYFINYINFYKFSLTFLYFSVKFY